MFDKIHTLKAKAAQAMRKNHQRIGTRAQVRLSIAQGMSIYRCQACGVTYFWLKFLCIEGGIPDCAILRTLGIFQHKFACANRE